MCKVCIIDDNKAVLIYMKSKLQQLLHSVNTFSNPLRALEYIPTINPDLIICDYIMFELTGLEVIEKLREQGLDTQYILFTSFRSPDLDAECKKLNIKLVQKVLTDSSLMEIYECLT